MKIAVVTDTNSGITEQEAKALDIHILAMPFTIDGTEYLEGITLNKKEFYEKQEGGSNIFTSQPSPASICELWEELLKNHDAVVHVPMSSSLSSTCDTSTLLSHEEEFEGKVFVADNQRISITQRAAAVEAKNMALQGKSPQEICTFLEETKKDSTIYVTVDTLKYLKKGGRITPAAAALGTLLRIKPVLTIQGGKLDSWAKARTMKQAKSMMLNAVKNDLQEKFGDPMAENSRIYVAHSNDEAAALEFAAELQEAFPLHRGAVGIYDLSLSVVTHTGPGTLAVGAVKRSEYLGDK